MPNPDALAASIHVAGLSYAYGASAVLHDVSFVVPRGKVVGLLGGNGAGKTTLTRVLSTFLAVQQGRCTVEGYDCARQALQVRQAIAVIPQGSTLNLELNVEQNILTYLRLRGHAPADARARLHEAAERFALEPYLQRNCMELSGGFRRRVQVARVFATNARCLLLDEASVGLDPVARRELWGLIREATGDRTVLLTTQILDEAEVCDTLLFLQAGRIVAKGTPEQLKSLHGNLRLNVTLKHPTALSAALIGQLEHLRTKVIHESEGRFTLSLPADSNERTGEVLRRLYTHQLPIAQTAVSPPSLEDVFVALHGGK